MKILMPFYQFTGDNKLDDPVVVGGMDRFMFFVWKYSDHEVIPIYYNESDRKSRKVTQKILTAIHNHNPDLYFVNYDSSSLLDRIVELQPDLPTLWITHQCHGGIGRIPQAEMMVRWEESGRIVGMVSPWQKAGMNKLTQRIIQKDLKVDAGFISPAFCSGDEPVVESEYDICNIGRCNLSKAPFLTHKYAKSGGFTSVIHTNLSIPSERDQEYHDKNAPLYSAPEYQTFYSLPHSEVMTSLGKASAYLSTHIAESFGIVVLESLARGVPVIIKTDGSGTHASETIVPDSRFYGKLTGNSKQEDFNKFLGEFKKFSLETRKELSDMTKEKHSLTNWKKSFDNMIDRTLSSVNKNKSTSSLLDFL